AVIPTVTTQPALTTYYRAINIDYTKVPNTDQTDFPILVQGTYSYLKTVANGGKVQNANGYDIGFYSDSGLTTPLKFEINKWSATTGELIAWIKIPTLSHTTNTTIYMAYGNPSITTDQSDPAGVWTNNYLSVWHLGDGTTLNLADSTSNNNTLVNGNSTPATPGKFYGGADFVGANSNYLYGGSTI
ncbi:MAG: DUF2341 domain-containing protein, partial [Candidatus Pacebacteria bacterium]|nr:DUF2341 domain-containing protein [Candidatus Paceibacterota bacterium]